MLIGAHVSAAGGLLPAIDRADAIGAEVLQVHTQSPRVWRPNAYPGEVLSEFAARLAAHPRVAVAFSHASYLINLGTTDEDLLDKSRQCLVSNLEVATLIGASGLVLHLGSHLGSGFAGCVGAVASELGRALDEAGRRLGRPACRLLIENAAGAGGTIGRSFAELGEVLAAAGGDPRLGVCVDTQHLFASGVAFESLEEADRVVAGLDAEVGLERLGCLHVNDSKVPLGANRDRHENLGEGFIGRRALGSLLAHPLLQACPAVLEVPGREKKGPDAADLRAARAIRAAGLRRWGRRLGATPPPPPAPLPGRDGRRGSPRGRSPAGSPSPPGR